MTLHTAFTLDQGAHVDAHTGKMVVDAYVVAPPTTCLRQNATAADVRDHIRQQMDDLPFEETIEVSRDSNTTVGSGYRYRVTFTGGAFSALARLQAGDRVSRLTAADHGRVGRARRPSPRPSRGERGDDVFHSVTR